MGLFSQAWEQDKLGYQQIMTSGELWWKGETGKEMPFNVFPRTNVHDSKSILSLNKLGFTNDKKSNNLIFLNGQRSWIDISPQATGVGGGGSEGRRGWQGPSSVSWPWNQDAVLAENQVEIWSEAQSNGQTSILRRPRVPLRHGGLACSPRPTPCPGRRCATLKPGQHWAELVRVCSWVVPDRGKDGDCHPCGQGYRIS